MQIRPLLALSCLAALGAVPASDRIAFAPTAESTLTKSFATTLDLALDDMLIGFNGQDMDPAMIGMDMSSASVAVELLVEVQDTYGEVADGRPLGLTRVFKAVSADAELGNGQTMSKSDEALEGATLTFRWNEEAGDYSLSCADKKLDLSKLSHTGEDMDLRGFLPLGEVNEGDSWTLAGEPLASVLWPGGNWAAMQAGTVATMGATDIPAELEKLTAELVKKASIECTYAGTREHGGSALQAITLGGELEHDLDIGEMLVEVFRSLPEGSREDFEIDIEATLELALLLSGELLWDAAAGHFARCELNLEIALLASMDGEAEMQGNKMALTAEVEASGVLRRRAMAR